MQKNWVKVFATQQEYKAQIVKDILNDHNIEAVIINKQDSAYLVFGEIEVFTLQEFALKASNIIKDIKYE